MAKTTANNVKYLSNEQQTIEIRLKQNDMKKYTNTHIVVSSTEIKQTY